MKLFTALAALTLIAAPAVKADVHRAYNGDMYTRCNFVGKSVFCSHNDEARDLDRRHAAKNACLEKIKGEHIAKHGQVMAQTSKALVDRGVLPADHRLIRYEIIGELDSAFYEKIGKSYLSNDAAHAEYRAKSATCFKASGF